MDKPRDKESECVNRGVWSVILADVLEAARWRGSSLVDRQRKNTLQQAPNTDMHTPFPTPVTPICWKQYSPRALPLQNTHMCAHVFLCSLCCVTQRGRSIHPSTRTHWPMNSTTTLLQYMVGSLLGLSGLLFEEFLRTYFFQFGVIFGAWGLESTCVTPWYLFPRVSTGSEQVLQPQWV